MIAVVLLVLIIVGVFFGRRKYIAQKEFRDHLKSQEATKQALNGSNANVPVGGYDQFGNGSGSMNGNGMMMNGGGMAPMMDRTSSFMNQQQSPMMTHSYGMQPDTYMMDLNNAGSYPDMQGSGAAFNQQHAAVTSQFEPAW